MYSKVQEQPSALTALYAFPAEIGLNIPKWGTSTKREENKLDIVPPYSQEIQCFPVWVTWSVNGPIYNFGLYESLQSCSCESNFPSLSLDKSSP